jgi:hypothetical protein
VLRITVGPKEGSKGTRDNLRSSVDNQVKENDINWAGSMHGKNKSSIHNFSRKSERKMPFKRKWHKMESKGFFFTMFKTTHWLDPNFSTKMLYSVIKTPTPSHSPTV